MSSKKKKSFTLIELLVVIAIIGILSGIVIVNLDKSRAKARDAKRLSDLRQIELALELYRDDYGVYPLGARGSGQWSGNCSAYGSYGTSGPTGYIVDLAPKYIPVLPLDPKPTGTAGCYVYLSNGTDYMFLAHVTVETYTPSNNPRIRPVVPTQNTFVVYTPGARNW